MSRGKRSLVFLLVCLAGWVYWSWDGEAPEISLDSTRSSLGPASSLAFEIRDGGRGLYRVRLIAQQAGTSLPVREEVQAGAWLPWAEGPSQIHLEVTGSELQGLGVREGPFELLLEARDQPSFPWGGNQAESRIQLRFDRTPPRLELLTRRLSIQQGGSEMVVYRLGEKGARSGVEVGEQRFQGYPLSPEGDLHAALFAFPHDGERELPISLWAQDEAGNQTRLRLPVHVRLNRFRTRTITLEDAFLAKVLPEILAHTPELEPADSPLETFLLVNGQLREKNHEFIRRLSQQSAPELLWNRPFLQLSGSQVESRFADYRTYLYRGREVDRQVHQGFDLASVAQAPVEAANDGVVAFADYLGIYGNCIVIDHGMGLFSLYGHLSSFQVSPGERVQQGQVLGRTGETGLAGGDHLHFSLILQGVQVTPLEWWDPQWVRLHILERIQATLGTDSYP